MKIAGFEFKIGADPELFIIEKATGKLVSAHGMLPGDKKNPHRVPHGAVQVDGMAAEFNIDPASNVNDFVRNIKSVMASLQEIIGDKYELVAIPTAHFGAEMIDAQPHEAKELGCDPDYNAWTGEENPTPDVDTPYRTGAGHVHIGWTNGQDIAGAEHKQICEHLIRNLDLHTTPFLRLEDDVLRRELYGKAGAYRPKSYGVEYRTPSNVWLTSEKNMRLMWRLVRQAIIACVHNRGLIQEGRYDIYDLGKMFKKGKGWDWFSHDDIVPRVLRQAVGDGNYV
jgi:hypothetical protein